MVNSLMCMLSMASQIRLKNAMLANVETCYQNAYITALTVRCRHLLVLCLVRITGPDRQKSKVDVR